MRRNELRHSAVAASRRPELCRFRRLHLDPARLDQRSAHERPLAMKLLPKDGMRCPAGRSGQIWITCPIGLLIGCSFILEEAIDSHVEMCASLSEHQ